MAEGWRAEMVSLNHRRSTVERWLVILTCCTGKLAKQWLPVKQATGIVRPV